MGFKPRPGGFLPWFGLVLQVFAPERKETDKQNRPDARLGGGEKPSPIAPHPFLGPAGEDKRHFPFLATGGGSPIAPAFSLTGVWFAPALLLHQGCPRCPAYFLETVVAFSLPAGPHCAAMLHLFICFEKKKGPRLLRLVQYFSGGWRNRAASVGVGPQRATGARVPGEAPCNRGLAAGLPRSAPPGLGPCRPGCSLCNQLHPFDALSCHARCGHPPLRFEPRSRRPSISCLFSWTIGMFD